MREPTVARDRERGTTGVIDTLSAGYAVVNKHPWVLVIPVLLDLLFWLGPHLSMAPLMQRAFGPGRVPVGLPAEVLQAYPDSADKLLQAGESFNLLSLLTTHYPGIPSLMAGRDGIGPSFSVGDPWLALGLFVLLPVAGIALASVFYGLVGRQVRGSFDGVGALLARAWRNWYRFLGFLLVMLAVGVLVAMPIALVVAITGSLNESLQQFVSAFVTMALLWAVFYLFFVVDAIVIGDVGPLRAIRNSAAVVRGNLGSTLGLVVLTWVIMLGMPIVWDALADNPFGVVAGIFGNAYISTGLAAASMKFYKDRYGALGARG